MVTIGNGVVNRNEKDGVHANGKEISGGNVVDITVFI